MVPPLYSRTVTMMLAEIRKHLPSKTNRSRTNLRRIGYNRSPQRVILPDARLKVKKVFVRPIERKIALEILGEIRKSPVFMEDLTTRISSMHKQDRLGSDWRSVTPNGVKTIYQKMVKARLIKEKK